MKKLNLGKTLVVASCLAAFGSASVAGAQSVHHDKMDARAARADIRRLEIDRKIARRNHDWKKVQQDSRLIRDDKKFVRKDVRKILNSHS